MIQLWNFNADRFTFWCCPGKSSEPPITVQGKFTCIVTPEHCIKDRRIQLWNIPISHYVTLSSEIENLTEDFKEKSETDMEFVQKFTQLDFQAKNFTPPISPNLNSFSKKKHKNEWKWRNLHRWQEILHSRRDWRDGQISPLITSPIFFVKVAKPIPNQINFFLSLSNNQNVSYVLPFSRSIYISIFFECINVTNWHKSSMKVEAFEVYHKPPNWLQIEQRLRALMFARNFLSTRHHSWTFVKELIHSRWVEIYAWAVHQESKTLIVFF